MSLYSGSKVDRPIAIETAIGKKEINMTIRIVFMSCMPTNIKAITGTTVAFGIALKPTSKGYKAIRIVLEKPIIMPKPRPTRTESDRPITVRQRVSQP